MFQKNLKYYRLKSNLSKKKLAEMVGVTAMAITNYEAGDRRPDMSTMKALAHALGVNVSDFLAVRNDNLCFQYGEFRKGSKLTQQQQEYIRESVEEYFNRFYEAIELLGGEVLVPSPSLHAIPLSNNVEECGQALRDYLGISSFGPVGSLVGTLENHGFLVLLLEIESDAFAGMNGQVNGRPFLVLNRHLTPERMRTTIGHELAHLAFSWPTEIDEKTREKKATEIAGSFLLTKEDAIRELGIRRQSITSDMVMVCKEYGISLGLLVVRAFQSGIINPYVYKRYFMYGRMKDDSFLQEEEKSSLFEQLVYRAVNEGEISVQKGAELLRKPFNQVDANCCLLEA